MIFILSVGNNESIGVIISTSFVILLILTTNYVYYLKKLISFYYSYTILISTLSSTLYVRNSKLITIKLIHRFDI